MKLLGSYRSPYVRKVRVIAAETELLDDIELEQHFVHLAASSPAVMALNPLNKIPTLITGEGEVLYDSFVICAYLVETAGRHDLLPLGGGERIEVMKTHALGDGLIDILLLRLVERAKPPEQLWREVIDATAAKIDTTLDFLNAGVARMEREGFTIGTMTVANALDYMDFRFQDLSWRTARKALEKWHDDIAARPSMRHNGFVDQFPDMAGRLR